MQNEILNLLENLNLLKVSLQKEFEFLLSGNTPDFVLKAKKRQIDTINFLSKDLLEIFDLSVKAGELKEKTEFCLINYGVTHYEFKLFINQPLKIIIMNAKRRKKEKSIQIPLIFDKFVDKPDEIKEIKFSDKPIIGVEKLKEMAKKAGSFIKTGKL